MRIGDLVRLIPGHWMGRGGRTADMPKLAPRGGVGAVIELYDDGKVKVKWRNQRAVVYASDRLSIVGHYEPRRGK